MTRMKLSGRRLEFEDNDIRRQQVIHSPSDELRRMLYRRGDLHMSHLSEGVHSGVGAAGTLHFDFAPKHFPRGLSKLAHDRARILLFLPAAVASAVVFD
jgi:hypothetical protein